MKESVFFTVFDWDSLTKSDVVGKGELVISNYENESLVFPIMYKEKISGEVSFELTFIQDCVQDLNISKKISENKKSSVEEKEKKAAVVENESKIDTLTREKEELNNKMKKISSHLSDSQEVIAKLNKELKINAEKMIVLQKELDDISYFKFFLIIYIFHFKIKIFFNFFFVIIFKKI